MGNYDDFDLDMKVTSETGNEPSGTVTTITTTLSLVFCPSASCMICISKENCTNDCTKGWCSSDCPTPTKDHPAASCHLKTKNGDQCMC